MHSVRLRRAPLVLNVTTAQPAVVLRLLARLVNRFQRVTQAGLAGHGSEPLPVRPLPCSSSRRRAVSSSSWPASTASQRCGLGTWDQSGSGAFGGVADSAALGVGPRVAPVETG